MRLTSASTAKRLICLIESVSRLVREFASIPPVRMPVHGRLQTVACEKAKACLMNHLHEQLEAVSDEVTILAFLQALAVDRRNDTEHWVNGTIEDFLEAATHRRTTSND